MYNTNIYPQICDAEPSWAEIQQVTLNLRESLTGIRSSDVLVAKIILEALRGNNGKLSWSLNHWKHSYV